jgi:hypothetical protein
MNKTEELQFIKELHTANYLYQSGEICHEELETRMLNILQQYADEQRYEFADWIVKNGFPYITPELLIADFNDFLSNQTEQ